MQPGVASDAPSAYCDFFAVAKGHLLACAVSYMDLGYNTGL